MRTCAVILTTAALVVVGAAGARAQTAADSGRPAAVAGHVAREGLTIDFAVGPADATAPMPEAVRAGDNVSVRFTIRDGGSGTPLSSLNPAAWIALARSRPDTPRATCGDQARQAISPTFNGRPELDLNAYYVLALNADATITVVDPLFGFGGSKLLALIPLPSPGEDWALTSDQNRLFVSMPDARGVAVIDTRSWTVATTIDIGHVPSRVALQPDEAYLWVADGDAGGGVSIVALDTLRVVTRLATGRGPHQIAFSDDNRFAFVANGAAGTVSVVDVRRLQTLDDVALGGPIASMAYSPRARVVYVTLPDEGVVAGIDAATHRVIARIPTAPGVATLAFAPDGRLGLMLNPRTNTVSVIDAAVNHVVRTAAVEKGPAQVAFSSRFAYVRHRDSEIVAMIALEGLDVEGGSTSQLEFPGGQHPGGGGSRTSLAPSVVRSGTDNAVVVANALDKAIYYYQEGMAAPMGQFSNYDREPTATMIVDRSLRESAPGVYESVVRLPAAGDYDAVVVIDRPRIVHCFPLSIAPAAGPAPEASLTARVEPLGRETTVRSGSPLRIALRLTDAGGAPLAGVADAQVLVVAAGVWQVREALQPEAKGIYAMTVVPPAPGLYDVYFTAPSRQMPYQRVFTFEAASEPRLKRASR
jgi:YVTN family beta-propeller protein